MTGMKMIIVSRHFSSLQLYQVIRLIALVLAS